jgi:hypothetical protein
MMPSLSLHPYSRAPIPSEIAPPPDQRLELVLVATGVQIYRCDPKKDQPGQLEWVLQAPEAQLRSTAGGRVGRHYAGPTWEAEDGSRIVGTVQSRVDAPPLEKAIPWLRLSARSTGAPGVLSKVTTVLRVATKGGLPPGPKCAEQDQGRIVRIDYGADYNFYVAR